MTLTRAVLTGPESNKVLECKFDSAKACPKVTNSSRCDETNDDDDEATVYYCACGYTGPQCSTCSKQYFESWSGLECYHCGDGNNHGPTIGLLIFVLTLALVAVACAFSNKARINANPRFQKLKILKKVGSVKGRLVFFTAQVLSEFSMISSSSGSGGTYPDPAKALAGFLGVTNLQIFRFVPLGCLLHGAGFYTKLLLKTLGPIMIILLMCMWPLSAIALRTPYEEDARTTARLGLLFLELVLPSVSTTIIETFVCQDFDDGSFLRAQLTLQCNASANRKYWVSYASVMLIIYPIGVPLLMFVLLRANHSAVRSLMQTMKDEDNKLDDPSLRGFTTIRSHARRNSALMKRPEFVRRSQRLVWVVKKVERFVPECWWMGVLHVLLRLCQTSLMVLVTNQRIQAALASCIALVGVVVHRELSPFRRPSVSGDALWTSFAHLFFQTTCTSQDNTAGVLGQGLLFVWCFVLVLRDTGVFDRLPAVVLGIFLLAITVAFLMYMLSVAWSEVRLNLRRRSNLGLIDDVPQTSGGQETLPSSDEPVALGDETRTTESTAAPKPKASAPSSWLYVCSSEQPDDGGEDDVLALLAEKDATILQLEQECAELTRPTTDPEPDL